MKPLLVLILFLFFTHLSYSTEPSKAFIKLAKKVRSSVVNISTTKAGTSNMVQVFPGYFMPFNQPQTMGSGSGFIVDKSGLIITNNHVVQYFDKIQIQFSGDQKLYPAKVLGTDTHSDIALLKVDVDKQLTPIQFGDSEKLEVGEWVAAIGNPYGYGHTMTKGIISAINREVDELNLFPLLQTDASINPGNSGGPLVNLKGEVVGVNQAIINRAEGIGFAIPINNVKEVFQDLKSHGFVRGNFIGVQFAGDPRAGVIVKYVANNSPAKKAGLKINDRIIKFDKQTIKKLGDLPKAVRKAKAGKKVPITIIRAGKKSQLQIAPEKTKKESFSSLKSSLSPKKTKLKGTLMTGGFQLVENSPQNLKLFNLPDLGAKNPIVLDVKNQSPAFKAGLRAGDLVFQINEKKTETVLAIKQALKKGKNNLNVLRYHLRYDKYYLISLKLTL